MLRHLFRKTFRQIKVFGDRIVVVMANGKDFTIDRLKIRYGRSLPFWRTRVSDKKITARSRIVVAYYLKSALRKNPVYEPVRVAYSDGTLKVLTVGYNEHDQNDVTAEVKGYAEFQRPPFEKPIGAVEGVELNASIFFEGLGGKMVYGLRKRLPRGHGLVNGIGPTQYTNAIRPTTHDGIC